jgi:Immunity protein Imm1
MSAASMEIMFWADGHEARVFERPDWDTVERAVRQLDGKTSDGLVVNGENGSYMCVAGGGDRRYVVAGKMMTGRGFVLAEGMARGQKEIICVGGQDNEYADYEVVSFEKAFQALKTFFEKGVCDDCLRWNEKVAARM